MTDGWFRARDRMHCSMIRKKLPSAFCGCYAKARCGLSKAATLRCAARRFVFTATHLAQLSSRANYENSSKVKALESARRRVRCDEGEGQWSRRALAPIRAAYTARGRAVSTEDQPRSRAWTDRRVHDRDRLDASVRAFSYVGGIVATE